MKFFALAGAVSAITVSRRDYPGVTFLPQVESDPITSSLGFKEWNADKDAGFPINYKVANFGQDHEIRQNFESLNWAERNRKHRWVFNGYPDKKKPPVEYGSAPLDSDIVDSLRHLNAMEKKHGTWKVPPVNKRWNPK